MKIIGVVLRGLYAIVAIGSSSSSATGDVTSPAPTGGATVNMDCAKDTTATSTVSKPNTTVTVTCAADSTVEPSASPPKGAANDIFLDATCTHAGVLSSVCPGATVTVPPLSPAKGSEGEKANVFIPQLPASQQVVCLKCKKEDEANNCLAIITVAPASPRGPQVCAGRGSSVTLRIDEAGGSAQFACGKDLALEPGDVTKAYADDCTNQETLKDMSRTTVTATYVTLKVDKLKKKRLCYLCKPKSAHGGEGKEVVKDESCKIYVEVSGSTRFSSRLHFSVALPCLAAMLRFS